MVVLGLVWLVLLVIELWRGLSPALSAASTGIWVIFIIDFVVRFTIAPRKRTFLSRNWLTSAALLIPALRVLRIARVARVLRTLRLLRVVTSVNRGLRSLAHALGRHGFGYVAAATVVMVIAGAAGMYAFERDAPNTQIGSFGDALWWTAMLITTLGSDYWPSTAEGRVLCLILSLYAIGVFGYVAATLASFFIGRPASAAGRDDAGLRAVQAELAALRAEIRMLRDS